MNGTVTIRTEAGAADCPVRGRIDAERCLSCSWLVSVRRCEGALAIRCRPSWRTVLTVERRPAFADLAPVP